MKRSKIFSRGFTLIELMVVVAIIAILVTIGLATYRNAQNRARDARLQSGAKAMQAVAEQAFISTNAYPASLSATSFSDNQVPANVTYSQTGSGTGYLIYTTTFSSNPRVGANCTVSGSPPTATWTINQATADRFCLTNLQ